MNPRSAILLCAMLLTACASTVTAPWEVSMTSSGGIAGRGNGGIVVDSDGTLAVTLIDGQQCEYDAIDDELASRIESSQPRRWRESYDAPCADCFDWRLTLIANETYTTSWNDAAELPTDLARIAERLRELKERYSEQCRVTPQSPPTPRRAIEAE